MALREVILTVLAHRPMTGYEISRNFDQVLSWFWSASHQQIYRELAKLNEDGRVRFKPVRQSGKPDKKVYQITRSGREELKRWLAQPTDPPKPQYELFAKLLAGASIGTSSLTKEIARVQQITTGILAQVHKMESQCLALPASEFSPYDRMLYLGLRRGLLLIAAQDEWIKEVQEYLETGRLKR